MGWADVFGITISVISVSVTILVVFVAYLLSRNYLSHIQEIQRIREEYDRLTNELQTVNRTNSALLGEAMLAVKTTFDLLMLNSRKSEYQRKLTQLQQDAAWKGRILGQQEVVIYAERIAAEMLELETQILARETEIYWLISRDNEQSAHLNALVDTKGDFKTVRLLEGLRAIERSTHYKDELLEAISRLRQRLGRPRRGRPIRSAAWTGRP